MAGGGEFLRAVLSQNPVTARQKWYTAEINFASTASALTQGNKSVQFNQDAYYLLTNAYAFYATDPVSGGGVVTNLNPNFDITLLRANGSSILNSTSQKNNLFPTTINQSSAWAEYILFGPGEQLFVTATNDVGTTEQLLVLLFEGIEYKEPS